MEVAGMEHEPEPPDTDQADLKSSLNAENEEPSFTSQNNEESSKSGESKEGSKSPAENKGLKSPAENESPRSPAENRTESLSDDKNKSGAASPDRSSPEPTCAICLGPLQNKSFTDSCFHTFCFTCLLSWSKVKPECPLCKQRFKSIFRNVRSIEDYDQYYLVSRSSESSWQSADGRRFRYSSTLTAERVLERRQRVIDDVSHQSDYQRHRSIYAPHSVRNRSGRTVPSTSRENSLSSSSTRSFRERIYEDGLWVIQRGKSSKIRTASSEFYRQNPACTHRLIPWLNRELMALLHNSETRVMFVMDLILALIMRYDIKSQEFHIHMQPYLEDRTTHFVHEFFNYATSPYDMSQYDDLSTYEYVNDCGDSHEDSVENLDFLSNNYQDSYDTIVLSSPGSDVIPLFSNDNSSMPTTSASTSSTSKVCRKKRRPKHLSKRVNKLYLKRNRDRTSWSVKQSTPLVRNNRSLSRLDYPSIDWLCEPGPSTSSIRDNTNVLAGPSSAEDYTTVVVSSGEDENDDEDECLIVDVVKPRHERTPEIIDIASSSDNEVETSSEKSSDSTDDSQCATSLNR